MIFHARVYAIVHFERKGFGGTLHGMHTRGLKRHTQTHIYIHIVYPPTPLRILAIPSKTHNFVETHTQQL